MPAPAARSVRGKEHGIQRVCEQRELGWRQRAQGGSRGVSRSAPGVWRAGRSPSCLAAISRSHGACPGTPPARAPLQGVIYQMTLLVGSADPPYSTLSPTPSCHREERSDEAIQQDHSASRAIAMAQENAPFTRAARAFLSCAGSRQNRTAAASGAWSAGGRSRTESGDPAG